MARYLWIGPAAGMALFSTAAIVSAQQLPGSDAPARERAPEGKAPREAPSAQPRAERRPMAPQPDTDRPKGVERSDPDRPKTTDRPDRDRPKAAERPAQDGPKTTDRPDQERAKGAERPDKTRPSTAQPNTDTAPPGRARLSERERGEVGAKLRQTGVEKTHMQVNLNVGSRIPRSVRLRPLPGAILASAPAYRGHSYFVLDDDTIVIADARTFVVIDVIPPATRAAGLSLSPDDMRFIFARVPRDRMADVRIRLALGAEIPRSVDLLRFPPDVTARVPEVERYRYVVAGDDVAIVDPRDNAVVLVISE
jgi:uncharacterized protein DUF1236